MTTVWVTYDTPSDCQCWRDALCTHGWTWREVEPRCEHTESFDDVHESLADAVRDLFPVGPLLRLRSRKTHRTNEVFVMRPGAGPLEDDHDAVGGPAPRCVISRYRLEPRTTVRGDEAWGGPRGGYLMTVHDDRSDAEAHAGPSRVITENPAFAGGTKR